MIFSLNWETTVTRIFSLGRDDFHFLRLATSCCSLHGDQMLWMDLSTGSIWCVKCYLKYALMYNSMIKYITAVHIFLRWFFKSINCMIFLGPVVVLYSLFILLTHRKVTEGLYIGQWLPQPAFRYFYQAYI